MAGGLLNCFEKIQRGFTTDYHHWPQFLVRKHLIFSFLVEQVDQAHLTGDTQYEPPEIRPSLKTLQQQRTSYTVTNLLQQASFKSPDLISVVLISQLDVF